MALVVGIALPGAGQSTGWGTQKFARGRWFESSFLFGEVAQWQSTWQPGDRFDSCIGLDPPGSEFGAVAQLGARLHGMQKAVGSIPTSSTRIRGREMADSVRRSVRFPHDYD